MSASPGFILILDRDLPATQRNRIKRRLESLGATVQFVSGGTHPVLEVFGDTLAISTLRPETWSGVARRVEFASPHPHVAWGAGRAALDDPTGAETARRPTVVALGGEGGTRRVEVGPESFTIMAGPCAVEEPEATVALARTLSEFGVEVFRAGIDKPRTSPYAFQGLGSVGLEALRSVREEVGLPVVTEILDVRHLGPLSEAVDLLQVGARNMQNFTLLEELGRCRVPVLLKRAYSATVREFLLAAEYILSGGNDAVILCERGLRSAAASEGVVLDIGAVAELRRTTHLPVILDPSHGGAKAYRVPTLAAAATASGCDGLLIEVHSDPEIALSDGQQALDVETFRVTLARVRAIRQALRD